MVIAASRTAQQMRAHGRHRDVRSDASQLKLDVRIELIEALVAAKLRIDGANKSLELGAEVVTHLLRHGTLPIVPIPRSASAARSLRLASCKVL